MEQLLALLGLGGGGLLSAFGINDLRDVGEAAGAAATDVAGQLKDMTQFQPFTVTSATGGTFNVGADGSVGMSLSQPEQELQKNLFGGAGQFFSQAMQDTAGREQDIYNRIRATQLQDEETQRLGLEERLAAQGRLGVKTNMFGGTPEQLAMEKAQAQSRNQATMMAMQQAQREQAQQAALGQQFLGGAYTPQSQLLNVQQASQLYPQLQQQMQMYRAGQYGETMLSGIEAQLLAEQARANMIGGLGSSLLGGLFTPVAQEGGGATNILTTIFGKG